MKAVIYHGPEDLRVEQTADPTIEAPTDVLLRVERTAICGSDLHLWRSHDWPEKGFAVGHEFLGTVEDVGSEVRSFRRGDRALASCAVGCGACACCRRALHGACRVTTREGRALNVFGFGGALPGGQAEAVRIPFADTNCFRVPESLSDEQSLFLTDILPTGFMAAELAEVGPGDTVVVFGCGPVGALAERCARLRGADRVIAVDVDEHRLSAARERGCDVVRAVSVVEDVMALTEGLGVDATIDAVGSPDIVNQAGKITRPGGVVAVVGVILEGFAIHWPRFFHKSVRIHTGTVSPQALIPRLVPLIEKGTIDPTEIISHRFPLDEAVAAYRLFADREDNALKIVLHV